MSRGGEEIATQSLIPPVLKLILHSLNIFQNPFAILFLTEGGNFLEERHTARLITNDRMRPLQTREA